VKKIMKPKKLNLFGQGPYESSVEMDKMREEEGKFYDAVFDPEDVPSCVVDDDTLYSIYLDDEEILIEKIREKYGVTLTKEQFYLPFWRILRLLENKERLPMVKEDVRES